MAGQTPARAGAAGAPQRKPAHNNAGAPEWFGGTEREGSTGPRPHRVERRTDKNSQSTHMPKGRRRGYEGRMPGVWEEALMAIKAGMPLYLAGLLGGATQLV